MIRNNSVPLPTFECGQVWQMIDSSLRIELVGKRLVHYKHYNLRIKRPTVLLANKAALVSFLQKHRAILQETPALPAVPGRSKPSRAKPGSPTAAKEN